MDCHGSGVWARRHALSCIVYGETVGRWWAHYTNADYCQSTMTAIGLSQNGYITAACVFENFNGASIVAHLAVKGRLTRQFLHELADYAFNRIKVNKLIAPVESRNKRMTKLADNMGFALEAYIHDAAPSGALMIFTMNKAQCRFLGEKYGKVRAANCSA